MMALTPCVESWLERFLTQPFTGLCGTLHRVFSPVRFTAWFQMRLSAGFGALGRRTMPTIYNTRRQTLHCVALEMNRLLVNHNQTMQPVCTYAAWDRQKDKHLIFMIWTACICWETSTSDMLSITWRKCFTVNSSWKNHFQDPKAVSLASSSTVDCLHILAEITEILYIFPIIVCLWMSINKNFWLLTNQKNLCPICVY